MQPVWSAFKGSTASSFVHRTASDNNGTCSDHLHVPGILQTQPACPLAVQLGASHQSSLSPLPRVQNGDSLSRVSRTVVPGP